MEKVLILLIFIAWFPGSRVLAYDYAPETAREWRIREIDRLRHLSEKKKRKDERLRLAEEQRQWREALEDEKERARQAFVDERDSRKSRMPASEILDDYKRHKIQKREIASQRSQAREQFVSERDKLREQKKKVFSLQLRRRILELERELESD